MILFFEFADVFAAGDVDIMNLWRVLPGMRGVQITSELRYILW
jgi:hypothetical protein